jgi:hypothetical protein
MHIHTYEQIEWTIKGKYDTAVDDDEEIMWMKINKEYVLPMWLVSNRLYLNNFLFTIWIGKGQISGQFHYSCNSCHHDPPSLLSFF